MSIPSYPWCLRPYLTSVSAAPLAAAGAGAALTQILLCLIPGINCVATGGQQQPAGPVPF